jgi:hypothetical protein
MTAPTTRPIDIKGRTIQVKDLTDAQMVLLAREARLASRGNTEPGRRTEAIARILDVLESAVVNVEDKEYLMDLTVTGVLEFRDMMGILDMTEAGSESEQKPVVRRGRPAKRQS